MRARQNSGRVQLLAVHRGQSDFGGKDAKLGVGSFQFQRAPVTSSEWPLSTLTLMSFEKYEFFSSKSHRLRLYEAQILSENIQGGRFA